MSLTTALRRLSAFTADIFFNILLITFPIYRLWNIKLPQNQRRMVLAVFFASLITILSAIAFTAISYSTLLNSSDGGGNRQSNDGFNRGLLLFSLRLITFQTLPLRLVFRLSSATPLSLCLGSIDEFARPTKSTSVISSRQGDIPESYDYLHPG